MCMHLFWKFCIPLYLVFLIKELQQDQIIQKPQLVDIVSNCIQLLKFKDVMYINTFSKYFPTKHKHL